MCSFEVAGVDHVLNARGGHGNTEDQLLEEEEAEKQAADDDLSRSVLAIVRAASTPNIHFMHFLMAYLSDF